MTDKVKGFVYMEEKLQNSKKGITGSTLKIIAVVTMLIDHIGAAVLGRFIVGGLAADPVGLWNAYSVMRCIGRISFPIYCFLLVEGFKHTHDIKKYAMRLGIFAIASEVPFDLCFQGGELSPDYQNVFFTLFIGLVTIAIINMIRESILDSVMKYMLILAIAILAMGLASLLHADYGWKGILCITVIYIFRNNKLEQAVAGAASFLWEMPAPLAFLPILTYNGKRGSDIKYFFYMFYPLHLLLLYLVCVAMKIGGIRVF